MSDQDSRTGPPVVMLGGGIGAGKSRIAELFGKAGFHVISTDDVGHAQLAPGAAAVAEVEALWPDTVDRGVVDRSVLAGHVFADVNALESLEAITHPGIEHDVRAAIAASGCPVVVEVPILKVFVDDPFTRIAVVADVAVRVERAVVRGADEADVRRRMDRQPSDDEWRAWATIVIDNSGDWTTTTLRVDEAIRNVLGRD